MVNYNDVERLTWPATSGEWYDGSPPQFLIRLQLSQFYQVIYLLCCQSSQLCLLFWIDVIRRHHHKMMMMMMITVCPFENVFSLLFLSQLFLYEVFIVYIQQPVKLSPLVQCHIMTLQSLVCYHYTQSITTIYNHIYNCDNSNMHRCQSDVLDFRLSQTLLSKSSLILINSPKYVASVLFLSAPGSGSSFSSEKIAINCLF